MEKISSQDFLRYLLKGLSSFPERVKITQTLDELGVFLSVSVAPEDMGKIIGTSGETAKSIRRIMSSFGYLRGQKVSVKIFEPGEII